jgi:hypothetical protein
MKRGLDLNQPSSKTLAPHHGSYTLDHDKQLLHS